MPVAILLQLVVAFALNTATTSLHLWRSAQAGRPPEATRLAFLNLMALSMTYILIRNARWRAAWRDLKESSKVLFPSLVSPKLTSTPEIDLGRIKLEPAHMTVTQPTAEQHLSWSKKPLGWSSRPDAANFLAVAILRRLAGLNLPDSYIGRTHHVASKLEQWRRGSQSPRLVRSRSPRRGVPVTYTFRRDRGRLHMVLAFKVRDDGNRLTVWWQTTTLRAGSTDLLMIPAIGATWLILAGCGYSTPAVAVAIYVVFFLSCKDLIIGTTWAFAMYFIFWISVSFENFSIPPWSSFIAAWVFLLVIFPPGRGWTSIWAIATCGRLLRAPADYPSPDDDERQIATEFYRHVQTELREVQKL